jgi:hypothetical protein
MNTNPCYRITEKGKHYFDLLGEEHHQTDQGRAFRAKMTPADWELEQFLEFLEDGPLSDKDDLIEILDGTNGPVPQVHRDLVEHFDQLVARGLSEGLISQSPGDDFTPVHLCQY